jgi:hypothetical protein
MIYGIKLSKFCGAVRFAAETSCQMIESRNPLTLTFSPQSRGEGIRHAVAFSIIGRKRDGTLPNSLGSGRNCRLQ